MSRRHLALFLANFLVVASCWAVTERIRLDDGWKFSTAGEKGTRRFTFDNMAAWLDDMGRDLMKNEVLPSIYPGKAPEVELAARDFNDGAWRQIRLPHDRGLDNGFDYDRNASDGCVAPERYGWYRRSLDIPASAKGRRVFFECDGAMAFSLVWINGHFVGGWPYGYSPWRVELTPHIDFGGKNVIAIRTAFIREASRFYTGAGLYRECHLAICPEDFLEPDSVRITTPEVSRERALVKVAWRMSRSGAKEKTFTVERPHLWNVDDPHLYDVEIEGEKFRYGIRSFAFHADGRRFQLNGRTVPIKGVCVHQDLDVLGNVWNRSAWVRRLRKLREAGANAIRMSHYRHPAGLYDLCDEMGFLVMDETFDQWRAPFNENDYHRLFPRWHERDLRAMVRANRNHPSIVIWSIGNEIAEQRTDLGSYDIALFRENGQKLMRIMREEDPTRPVTTANNNGQACLLDEVDFVDVYGFNYRWQQFAPYHAARPAKPTISTETGCYIATRGEYFFPAVPTWEYRDFHSSSYLLKKIAAMDDEWAAHDAVEGHAGGFYWTGFDYLGGPASTPRARKAPLSEDPETAERMKHEIAPYGQVRRSMRACPTGFFDLAGFPRDVYWQFKARWCPQEPMVHLLPHWNWPERVGQKVPVTAFSSGDEVELFVNGVSQGRRRISVPGTRFCWDEVTYAPGEITAIAYRQGVRWAETKVETTGNVARFEVVPECAQIAADGYDVAYVNLAAVDAQGRVVPRTRLPARIAVSGDGELVGVENGDEADLTSFVAAEHVIFNGHLSIVVRAKGKKAGKIRVRVEAEGVPAAEAVVDVVGK
ncbi:MAG: DUF4982 domain-containing protein [Kiritimatiellae bacterium]|nr:DUF4982 domain-containing protein [Kiritimatiellia bacterium]